MSIISSKFYTPNHDTYNFGPVYDYNYKATPVEPFGNARIECQETHEAHIIKAELPGLKREEVKVEIEEGNLICLTGEKNIEREKTDNQWYRVERSRARFVQRFKLPENAKTKRAKVHMENGVLTIVVPKKEQSKIISTPLRIF